MTFRDEARRVVGGAFYPESDELLERVLDRLEACIPQGPGEQKMYVRYRDARDEAEAQLSKIEALCAWSEDEPHMRANELVPSIRAILRGEV